MSQFRCQMVELVRAWTHARGAGARAIRALGAGRRSAPGPIKTRRLTRGVAEDGLTSDEREECRRLRRDEPNSSAASEREDLSKSRGLVCSGRTTDSIPSGSTAFVRANQAMYRTATMCRVLGVSSPRAQRLLRVAQARAVCPLVCRSGAHQTHSGDPRAFSGDLRRAARPCRVGG